ncbi:MAG: hypothetical protein ABIA91_01590 [Patescibacteria group bacterium]
MKTRTIKPKIEKKLNSSKDGLSLKLSNRDHFMYDVFYNKQKICVFKISHTSKEYGKRLIGMMARGLGITSSQLKGIEKCIFWGKDFVKKSRLLN